ncbi:MULTISPECIES: dihydrofolate reductase [Caulobacter]|jgi:dihydrofolate reductase|uniref:dihydrofolate reductase n=1 Tax=Caulobacter TaxID=75 RepID=UPI0006F430D9|nr:MULTISPECIES: dihydrofolate reductase [Caulobacter]KQZ18291.1 dihydrofolate reductase [Caulobacter sp. Root1472]GGL38584.1 dihydrofolate reductase [Caulobacter rhizosphaerae]
MSVILTVGPVARSLNGVIGRDNDLPWRLKSDLAIFKACTMGKPVIMGRKTWDSLPRKPLPGRMNIVLSRDGSFEPPQAVVCESFLEAVQMAKEQAAEDGVDEVCVIGGRALFETALPKAKRLYLTEVQAEVQGDVSFPAFDEAAWTEVRREEHPAGPDDDHAFVFRVLERR